MSSTPSSCHEASGKIYLNNNQNSYKEWSFWLSNNLLFDDLHEVTMLGMPVLLETFKASLSLSSPSQPAPSGVPDENAAPRPPGPPVLSASNNAAISRYTTGLQAKDIKARKLIVNSLDRNQMTIIQGCSTAHLMWQALLTHHGKGAEGRFMELVPVVFRNDTYSLTNNFKVHVCEVLNAVQEIDAMGVKLPGFAVAALLIHLLPPEWDTVASSLTPDINLTMDLQDILPNLYAQVDRKLSVSHDTQHPSHGGEYTPMVNAICCDYSKVCNTPRWSVHLSGDDKDHRTKVCRIDTGHLYQSLERD